MSTQAASPRLTEARQALAALQTTDLGHLQGNVRDVPELRRLLDAFDALIAAGETESVYPAYMEVYEPAIGNLKTVLDLVSQRVKDGAFLNHSTEGVRISRADFFGTTAATLPEESIELFRAGDALIPRGTRPGESTLISLLAELQLFVSAEGNDAAAVAARARPLDGFGLFGTVALVYGQRLERRVLWGSGSCALTNERLLGVLFDDEVDGRRQSAETKAMPSSVVAGDASSALVFEVGRDRFERREITVGKGAAGRFFMSRFPTVNLIGKDCDAVIDVKRVVRAHGSTERPAKDEVENAVLKFCGEQ